MNGRIALAAGAAAALVASLGLGPGDVRAFGQRRRRPEDREAGRRPSRRRRAPGRDDRRHHGRRPRRQRPLGRRGQRGREGRHQGRRRHRPLRRRDACAARASSSRLVAETPAGRAVAIEVTRGGATQKLTATLAEGGRGFAFPRRRPQRCASSSFEHAGVGDERPASRPAAPARRRRRTRRGAPRPDGLELRGRRRRTSRSRCSAAARASWASSTWSSASSSRPTSSCRASRACS